MNKRLNEDVFKTQISKTLKQVFPNANGEIRKAIAEHFFSVLDENYVQCECGDFCESGDHVLDGDGITLCPPCGEMLKSEG